MHWKMVALLVVLIILVFAVSTASATTDPKKLQEERRLHVVAHIVKELPWDYAAKILNDPNLAIDTTLSLGKTQKRADYSYLLREPYFTDGVEFYENKLAPQANPVNADMLFVITGLFAIETDFCKKNGRSSCDNHALHPRRAAKRSQKARAGRERAHHVPQTFPEEQLEPGRGTRIQLGRDRMRAVHAVFL